MIRYVTLQATEFNFRDIKIIGHLKLLHMAVLMAAVQSTEYRHPYQSAIIGGKMATQQLSSRS